MLAYYFLEIFVPARPLLYSARLLISGKIIIGAIYLFPPARLLYFFKFPPCSSGA